VSGVITPQSALGRVPGWDGACITELQGGLSNDTFKVTAGGRSAVLKIDNAPRLAPFNTRAEEAHVQNMAADAGLAARVLYADEQVYITEFLDGEVWNARDISDSESLEKLATALKRLHAMPLTGRTFDAVGAAQRYAETSCGVDRELTDYCTETILATRQPGKLCCCHNDLVAENLINTPALKFLDWEYACDNDPLFDLATVVEHHALTEEQAASLLSAYSQGDAGAWSKQFTEQRGLYLALLWLWMAARPDSNSSELVRVAMRLKSMRHGQTE
jgi:thiamine kinase-like enzyme